MQFNLSMHDRSAWSAAQAPLLRAVRGAMCATRERRTIRLIFAWRSRSTLCQQVFELGMTQLSWGGVRASCSRTTGRSRNAQISRDRLVADRTADICCFKSGGGLREGIIPIGLGLRAVGRMRF